MFSLVIFDLDGTLADSFPWFLGVVNGVAREHRLPADRGADIEPLRRAGSREILRRLEVPLWKLPAIGRRDARAQARARRDIPLFPGYRRHAACAVATRGSALALVSSDNEDNARRQLGDSAAHFLALRLRRFAVRQGGEVQE